MYNKNIKPIYNYDLKECNLLFKKGIYPIGCGVGDRDGLCGTGWPMQK